MVKTLLLTKCLLFGKGTSIFSGVLHPLLLIGLGSLGLFSVFSESSANNSAILEATSLYSFMSLVGTTVVSLYAVWSGFKLLKRIKSINFKEERENLNKTIKFAGRAAIAGEVKKERELIALKNANCISSNNYLRALINFRLLKAYRTRNGLLKVIYFKESFNALKQLEIMLKAFNDELMVIIPRYKDIKHGRCMSSYTEIEGINLKKSIEENTHFFELFALQSMGDTPGEIRFLANVSSYLEGLYQYLLSTDNDMSVIVDELNDDFERCAGRIGETEFRIEQQIRALRKM